MAGYDDDAVSGVVQSASRRIRPDDDDDVRRMSMIMMMPRPFVLYCYSIRIGHRVLIAFPLSYLSRVDATCPVPVVAAESYLLAASRPDCGLRVHVPVHGTVVLREL